MKILTLADLHLDLWDEQKIDPLMDCEAIFSELDLLLIAGDLTNKPKVRWPKYLERLVSMTGPGVVKIFAGNHDFYQYRIDAEDRLAEFATSAGAEYVNRKTITAGDQRFICATLWTDFKLAPGLTANERYIPTRMNDYRVIRHGSGGYRKLMPKDTIAIHHRDLEFIAGELSKPFNGTSVVVTHHAPHPAVLADYSENLDAAYASDLSTFIKQNRPDRWLFGHCHDAKNVTVEGCSLENISVGYPGEIKDPNSRIRSLVRST